MLISGLKCPNCGASLEAIDDTRKTFFCSYCGCSLAMDYDEGEAERILRIKEAESELNKSKAQLARDSAVYLEAETKNIQYKNMHRSDRTKKTLGIVLLVLSCIAVVVEVVTGCLLISGRIKLPEGIDEIGVMFVYWALLALFAITLLGIGASVDMITFDRTKIELQIRKLEDRRTELEIESEKQCKIIASTGMTLWGEKAQTRLLASEKNKTIRKEIKELSERIDSLLRKIE